MGVWKIETHLHTAQGSACAVSTGAEMAHAHKKAGYDAIIVTDHFFNGNTAVPTKLSWAQRVCALLEGYEDARREGESIGLCVFLGWEWNYHGTEFLTYGLTEEFLLDQPDMLSWDAETYLRAARAAGGFISHAHPYRSAAYIHKVRLYPDLVDAVEVHNAHNPLASDNSKALEFAQKYDLAWTAGSDTHDHRKLLGSGMVFERKLHSLLEFTDAVRSREPFIIP